MSKLTELQRLLDESNAANKVMLDRLASLTEERDNIKDQLLEESTKIRIPNKLNAYQFNELCEHLNKVRDQFVKALETPMSEPLDILEPAVNENAMPIPDVMVRHANDSASNSHVN